MKKIITLLYVALTFPLSLFSQIPEKMSYQGVIRNSSNNLVTNSNVKMRLSILQGSSSGSAVYVETHSANTNANGLLTVEIGAGSIVSGAFSNIDWSSGPYFIKTETDPLGGTNYTISGTSELLSVPYALYSKSSGQKFFAGNGISISGDTIYNISPNQDQTLSKNGDTLKISNGNSILLNSSAAATDITLRQITKTGFFMGVDEIRCVTSTQNGSVLIVALSLPGSGLLGCGIVRLEKDQIGYYHATHFLPPSNFDVHSMTVVNNYVYLAFNTSGPSTTGIKRVNLSDLGDLTNMTFNPSKPSLIEMLSTNGTNLFIRIDNNSSTNIWQNYQIITTALINTGSDFNFIHSAGDAAGLTGNYCFFDGNYYYVSSFRNNLFKIAKFDSSKNFITETLAPAFLSPNSCDIAIYSQKYLVNSTYFIDLAYQHNSSGSPEPTPVLISTPFLKP